MKWIWEISIKHTFAHEAGHCVGLEEENPPGSAPFSSWVEDIMNHY